MDDNKFQVMKSFPVIIKCVGIDWESPKSQCYIIWKFIFVAMPKQIHLLAGFLRVMVLTNNKVSRHRCLFKDRLLVIWYASNFSLLLTSFNIFLTKFVHLSSFVQLFKRKRLMNEQENLNKKKKSSNSSCLLKKQKKNYKKHSKCQA